MDDLAGAISHATIRTRVASVLLAILWILFLIVAGGLKDHTWYLLAVGALGMVQNVAVAGLPRTPAAHGIPLSKLRETFGKRVQNADKPKVMDVLFKVEDKYPGVGLALRPEFFQDYALKPNEVDDWKVREKKLNETKARKKRVQNTQAAAASSSKQP